MVGFGSSGTYRYSDFMRRRPSVPPSACEAGRNARCRQVFTERLRDIEDAACNAGMRNPSTVHGRWPSLVAAMAPVRKALLKALRIRNCRNYYRSWKVAGEETTIVAVHRESKAMRRETLGLFCEAGEAKRSAGQLRHNIVGAVQQKCNYPDAVLPGWLDEDAAMGIIEPITPGGLFPLCPSPAEAEVLDSNF